MKTKTIIGIITLLFVTILTIGVAEAAPWKGIVKSSFGNANLVAECGTDSSTSTFSVGQDVNINLTGWTGSNPVNWVASTTGKDSHEVASGTILVGSGSEFCTYAFTPTEAGSYKVDLNSAGIDAGTLRFRVE